MKLATYEKILKILPIPGADRIELVQVQGWQVVVRKADLFQVGQTIVFVPIDTLMEPREWNKFLWNKDKPDSPIRIKTAKLQNTISQGLVFPLSVLDNEDVCEDNLASFLGINKYEKPVPANLAGQVAGNFPTHLISKTDEDNLLSNIDVLEELKQCDEIRITLKLDGTSATFIKVNDELKVCSRNLELKDGDNAFWNIARKYDLFSLPNNTVIQGEIVGPGIQKNPLGLSSTQLFVFNKKDLETNSFINCNDLQSAPIVKTITGEDVKHLTLDDLIKLSNEQVYSNNKPAEGIVIRGFKNESLAYSNILRKMLSVKIINQNYKD